MPTTVATHMVSTILGSATSNFMLLWKPLYGGVEDCIDQNWNLNTSHFNKRFKELLKAEENERSLPLPLPPSHLRTCYTLHKLLLLSPERKLITQGARVTKLTNYRVSTYKNKDEQVQFFWQVYHSHCANSEVQNLSHSGGIFTCHQWELPRQQTDHGIKKNRNKMFSWGFVFQKTQSFESTEVIFVS